MHDEESILGWVFAAIATVVSTLAGLIAMFYKTQLDDHREHVSGLKEQLEKLRQRADQCEDDRENLRVQIAKLEVRVEWLEKENGHVLPKKSEKP